MNKRIILLNGPVGCGKDYIAEALIMCLGGTKKEFKDELYKATAEHFGLQLHRFKELATGRKSKEVPFYPMDYEEYEKLCNFLGKVNKYENGEDVLASPRELLIYTSELVYKPMYGKDYFGVRAAEQMDEGNNYVSDSGFVEEAEVQVVEHGKENVLLIRIHRDGAEFSPEDSRSYINLDHIGVPTLDLDNNRDIDLVVKDIADFMYVNLKGV